LIESASGEEPVKHFIFSSTAATYGTPEQVPIRETSAPQPINPLWLVQADDGAMLADVAFAHPAQLLRAALLQRRRADPQGRSGQSTAGATHLIKVAVEAMIAPDRFVELATIRWGNAPGQPHVSVIRTPDQCHPTEPGYPQTYYNPRRSGTSPARPQTNHPQIQ
jgi:hypothetical protein